MGKDIQSSSSATPPAMSSTFSLYLLVINNIDQLLFWPGKREFLLSTGLLSTEQELMMIVWQVLDKIVETRNTKDCKNKTVLERI